MSQTLRVIQSNIYNDIWILYCRVDADFFAIYLQCIGWPKNVLSLQVKWQLCWREKNCTWERDHEFKIIDAEDVMVLRNIYPCQNWKSYEKLSFDVKIVVVEERN
eukprot:390454_1